METQKFKSTSIREIVNCALHGKPINVQSRELFELSDVDVDDDSIIVDEFADGLEVESYFRQSAELNFVSNYGKSKESKDSKESNETKESKSDSHEVRSGKDSEASEEVG